MKLNTLVASLVLVIGSSAFAQTPATPRIDKREANQEKRIEQGVASGQLTAREEKRLDARETHLESAEAKAKADGTVTAKERKRLHVMAAADSKAIRRQKHDGQRDLDHDGKRDRKATQP
jgi:hypothetical protein